MAIVYQHRRKDTGEVFYIGIGSSKVGEVCRGLRPHTRGFIFKFKN
jgi:hypothetical protein